MERLFESIFFNYYYWKLFEQLANNDVWNILFSVVKERMHNQKQRSPSFASQMPFLQFIYYLLLLNHKIKLHTVRETQMKSFVAIKSRLN